MRSGVRFYTDGMAEVTIHFPEDDVVCRWCHLFQTSGYSTQSMKSGSGAR